MRLIAHLCALGLMAPAKKGDSPPAAAPSSPPAAELSEDIKAAAELSEDIKAAAADIASTRAPDLPPGITEEAVKEKIAVSLNQLNRRDAIAILLQQQQG